MEAAALEEIVPWYLGFTGAIRKHKENSFISHGAWKWIDDATLEVSELPIGTWTEDYKDHLTEMIADGSALLKDFENHYTDKTVRFVLKMYPGKRAEVERVLETEFKLASSKNLSMNNLHLYNARGAIQRFRDTAEIVKAWARVRLSTYYDRKAHQLKVMEAAYRMLAAKIKFINDVIAKKIDVMNRKEREVEDQLKKLGYPKLGEAVEGAEGTEGAEASVGGAEGDDEGAGATGGAPKPPVEASYRYLTNMPIRQLTYEERAKLENEGRMLKDKIDRLRAMQIHHIWRTELEEFRGAWEQHRAAVERSYSNAAAAAPAHGNKRGKKAH